MIPEIYRTLVEPYTVAVRSGDYATAYQRYTSAAFKQAHPFEEYLKAQNANLEDLGPLVEVTLKEDEPFQSAGNLFSGRRYHQGGLRWRGEKREAWLTGR